LHEAGPFRPAGTGSGSPSFAKTRRTIGESGGRLNDTAQKVGDPGDEREFDAINVDFFVIKKSLHSHIIT
jgi:hypothetical protein